MADLLFDRLGLDQTSKTLYSLNSTKQLAENTHCWFHFILFNKNFNRTLLTSVGFKLRASEHLARTLTT